MGNGCKIYVFLICVAVLLVGLALSVNAANYSLIDDKQNVSKSTSILGSKAPAGMPAASRWSKVELTPVISKPDVLEVGDTLTLNLFSDAVYTAHIDKFTIM